MLPPQTNVVLLWGLITGWSMEVTQNEEFHTQESLGSGRARKGSQKATFKKRNGVEWRWRCGMKARRQGMMGNHNCFPSQTTSYPQKWLDSAAILNYISCLFFFRILDSGLSYKILQELIIHIHMWQYIFISSITFIYPKSRWCLCVMVSLLNTPIRPSITQGHQEIHPQGLPDLGTNL